MYCIDDAYINNNILSDKSLSAVTYVDPLDIFVCL